MTCKTFSPVPRSECLPSDRPVGPEGVYSLPSMETQQAMDLFVNPMTLPLDAQDGSSVVWPLDTQPADGSAGAEARASVGRASSSSAARTTSAKPVKDEHASSQKKKRRAPSEARLVQNAEAQKRYR